MLSIWEDAGSRMQRIGPQGSGAGCLRNEGKYLRQKWQSQQGCYDDQVRRLSPNGGCDHGALIGSAVDWSDAATNASLMEHVLGCVTEDQAVLMAVVEEKEYSSFDANFEKYSAEVTRFDAAEVAEKIAQAQRVQEEMAREAKKKLREEKKKDRRQAVEERRAKIADYFKGIKSKHKK